MNDLTDDILSDLADLESSTEELTQKTSMAKNKHHTLEGLDSAQRIDSATLVLEAAKAAQEAATQSQHAAESAIKLSNDFKAQIIELSDSNASWRQTARSTSQDILKSRNAMLVTMSITVVMGVITTSLSAWFLYYNSKKQEMFKGEVLDLIQTENALNNKGITLKVDQLSSLIEALSADIQALKIPNMTTSTSAKEPTHAPVNIHAVNDDEPIETPETANAHDNGHNEHALPDAHAGHAPVENHVNHNEQMHHQDTHATENKPIAHNSPTSHDNHAAAEEHQDTPHAVAPKQHEEHASNPIVSVMNNQSYEELKNLVNLILDKQQKLEAAILTQSQWLQKNKTMTTTQPILAENSNLSDKQVKQLDGIGWLVRKQEKTLNEIQAIVKSSGKTSGTTISNDQGIQNIEKSLNELKAQIHNLAAQQRDIESQVTDLQAQTKKLSESPKPYSYQSR
ncbi:hypothetical protein [Thiosulfativibrio zosterae]|uniref:Uncharacterized protein n=1 Tax=Thiosulfativibrio zosterae TaxID=2675053 RepID=A0A6F8PPF8_9GAMM|nr:hypothetical protein [Thiosulfativibrio zosterae]BBP43927.1 hypothetical protein THMIRHAT_16730 [Thiosulfativibrio zosterae]